MNRGPTAVIVCLLFAAVACGNGNAPATLTADPSVTSFPVPTPAEAVPAGSAKITITSPADGASVKASELEVVTAVTGFKLVDKLGKPSEPGEGHIIYYLGAGYEIPVKPGVDATSGGSGAFTAAYTHKTSFKFMDPAPGRETLTVQLVNNDNTPLDPAQSAQVTVNVTP